MKHYFRVYSNYKQNNWSEILSMTAFVYNNSIHSSIERISNDLLKEYTTSFVNASENRALREKTFLIIERAQWFREIRKQLKALWKHVSKQQAKHYNAHHKQVDFKMRNKVLLRSVNIRTLRSKKKIDHRQLSFFEILEKIETQTYKLNLSSRYEIIHFIFHVFLLKFWHFREQNSEPQSILVEEKEKWKIEKMLDKRTRKEKLEYLIQWVDLFFYENFWKSKEHLSNAKQRIQNFEKKNEAHKSVTRNFNKRKRDRSRKV